MAAHWEIKKLENAIVKVTIKITRQFRFRIWIACKLIWLAASIMGCGIEIVKAENDAIAN